LREEVIAQGSDKLDDDALTNLPVLKHSTKVKARKATPPETGRSRQAQRMEPRRGRKTATKEVGLGGFEKILPVEDKEANLVDSEEMKPSSSRPIHFCPNF
jgi:hypothetical protein